MNLWHEVSYGENAPKLFNVIIENPRGNKNKYEVDKKTGLIKLDRPMKTAQDFPFDYGFVPQTYWHDNDPLDVIVMSTYPLHPGVLVEVRPVAVFRMVDCGEKDDKILTVPVDDPRWDKVQNLQHVNPHTIKEFTHFFETYKSIEDGKKVEIKKVEGKKEALAAVKEGIALYKKKFNNVA
jgi:inorganic pyrophosphatase